MNSSNRFELLTMGRCSIDLYSDDVGAPFDEITSFSAYVGGSPTNIAVGAQRLGLRTALLTALGEDLVGDFILRFLNNEQVGTQYIPRKPGTRTPAVLLGIEPPDKFPLVFYRHNASDTQLTIDDVLSSPVEDADAFEFAGTNLNKDPERSATSFAADRARRSGAQVYMDLDFRADQWHDVQAYGVAVRAILPTVHVAIGTEEEIKAAALQEAAQVSISESQITAPEVSGDLGEAIEALLAYGLNALVVKHGEEGAAAHLANGEVIRAAGYPVKVLNVLGAGDAFASGLIYGLSKDWEWHDAMRVGNACGAILVTKQGVANFMPTEEEALAFIDQHGGL